MAEKKVDSMSNPEAPGNAVSPFEAGDIPHILSQIARLGEGPTEGVFKPTDDYLKVGGEIVESNSSRAASAWHNS